MTDTTPRTLEQRVAALEELAAHPLMVVEPPALTDEQAAEFETALRHALDEAGPVRVLPPPPPLTPEQVRQLLSECVTVVKPGETLVVLAARDWTPNQVRDVQEYADAVAEYRELGVKILFLPGEEFAVAKKAKSAPGTVEINVTAPEGVDTNALTAHLRGAAMNYRPRNSA